MKKRDDEIRALLQEVNFNTYEKPDYNLKKEFLKTLTSLLGFIKIANVRHEIMEVKIKSDPMILPHPKFGEILMQAKEISFKNNANFYFVYLPDSKRFEKDIRSEEYKKILSIMHDKEIDYIDVYKEIISKYPKPLNLYSKSHEKYFNEDGYKFIADKIYQYINFK